MMSSHIDAQVGAWALFLFAFMDSSIAASDTAYIYLNNTDYIANSSNVVAASWPAIQAGFATPNQSDVANFSGLDWTKSYPGSTIAGFQAHLRIANDVAFPSTGPAANASTNIAALSYGIPDSLMGSDGLPKGMDSSWFICQHYFISTLPDPTQAVEHDCSFLPAQCQADLKSSLVTQWGAYQSDTGSMCGGLTYDVVTPSCQESLGPIRADVLGKFNSCRWHKVLDGCVRKLTHSTNNRLGLVLSRRCSNSQDPDDRRSGPDVVDDWHRVQQSSGPNSPAGSVQPPVHRRHGIWALLGCGQRRGTGRRTGLSPAEVDGGAGADDKRDKRDKHCLQYQYHWHQYSLLHFHLADSPGNTLCSSMRGRNGG